MAIFCENIWHIMQFRIHIYIDIDSKYGDAHGWNQFILPAFPILQQLGRTQICFVAAQNLIKLVKNFCTQLNETL